MPKRNSNKRKKTQHKLRGSRGFTHTSSIKSDLFVCMPRCSNNIERDLTLQSMMERYRQLHYTHLALTHTIYGRPKPAEDASESAIPDALVERLLNKRTSNDDKDETSTTGKKRKRPDDSPTSTPTSNNITILKRLHVVLENLSDVPHYGDNSPSLQLLKQFDLVSIAPANENVLKALLQLENGPMVDILTLDYTLARGLKLPYKLRAGDIQKLKQQHHICIEIPMAPALLNLKHRKSLMAAARELQMASVGKEKQLPLVLGSGDRVHEEEDAGALVVHSVGDLSNLATTVLQFHAQTAAHSMTQTTMQCLQQAQQRRGQQKPMITRVQVVNRKDLDDDGVQEVEKDGESEHGDDKEDLSEEEEPQEKDSESDDGDDGDDGFVAL